jgi:L-fuconolactonase
MIIDAHQHIWDLAQAEYSWLGPDLAPINRTITFDELVPTLAERGITGSVLVQAADNAEDTELMLDAAQNFPQVVAVVAWAPLDRPDALAPRLAELAEHPVVRGIRNLFHNHPREWATSPEVDRGIGVLAASKFTLDFVTSNPAALADLPGIGARHPELDIVIDHLGKPPVGGTRKQRAEWRALLSAAAANPRVYAKVSGLYAAAGDPAGWTTDDVRPFFEDALEVFGARRLMYGGDWPISEIAGGYERTWESVQQLVAELSVSERDALLGGTAANFYRISLSEGA